VHTVKIDPYKLSVVIAVIFSCLLARAAFSQDAGSDANADNLTESGIQPQAMQSYERAVHELHQGHAVVAEADANRALQQDPKFADAAALAATASLAQEQFVRAAAEAAHAIQIDAADEKAYVILATAENYLGHYAAAANALGHVRPQAQQTWQVAYQWARTEAGMEHSAECLEWLNRAALSAPINFAPLHLLRASALLAMGDKTRAADELEIYLQFPSVNPAQREALTGELHRLREPSPTTAASQPVGN
jgi:tetratricopeptide (TPR) repeat protein